MPRGGGRGGRGGGGQAPSREVQVSKKLSWLLRHGAEKEGLKLGKGGYINLAEVLSNKNLSHLKPPPTLDEIMTIVDTNEKKRFSLIRVSDTPDNGSYTRETPISTPLNTPTDADPSNYLIRANQGHSLKVDEEGLLVPITLTEGNLPPVVVHGTRLAVWQQIVASGGLKKMTRNHVHFATGVPAALQQHSLALSTSSPSSAPLDKDLESMKLNSISAEVEELPDKKDSPVVLSGMRNSSNVLIFLDLKRALEEGVKFAMSANGVVLSEGDDRGIVGLEFFRRVENLKDKLVLVENGEIVADAS